jgi:hypothetical protein
MRKPLDLSVFLNLNGFFFSLLFSNCLSHYLTLRPGIETRSRLATGDWWLLGDGDRLRIAFDVVATLRFLRS